MSSPRLLKLAEQIKNITAQMLERRIKDPRLGFVTLTDARLTGDSREATVFYTVLGDEAARASTQAALQSATGVIRSQIGKQLGLRYTPTLTFILDAVPENAQHIEELLAKARLGDAALLDQSAGATHAGDPDPYKKKPEDTAQDRGQAPDE